MKGHDYYQLLGVSRRASQETLRHAFRSRLLLVHPDQNSGDAASTEQTREVVEAYRVLSDPTARREYDNALAPFFSRSITQAPPPPVRCSPAISRALVMVCFVFMVAFAAFLIGQEVASSRGPVFRAVLIDQPRQTALKQFPILPEPGVSDTLEWYHARAYQLSLGDKWTTHELVKTYSEAARQASIRGDMRRARFYSESLRRAMESRATPLLQSGSG